MCDYKCGEESESDDMNDNDSSINDEYVDSSDDEFCEVREKVARKLNFECLNANHPGFRPWDAEDLRNYDGSDRAYGTECRSFCAKRRREGGHRVHELTICDNCQHSLNEYLKGLNTQNDVMGMKTRGDTLKLSKKIIELEAEMESLKRQLIQISDSDIAELRQKLKDFEMKQNTP